MMYINKNGDIIELTSSSATNCYGNKLLWVRCANGNIVSVSEDNFHAEFTPVA